MVYRTDSSILTKKLGARLGKKMANGKIKGPAVFALHGELGSGKTTFIQGFARGAGVRHTPKSPTFLLIRNYSIRRGKFRKLFHVDAYRIKKPKELKALGIKEILLNPSHIVLIEWAEKIARLLPRKTVHITFSHGKRENERRIAVGARVR